MSKLPIYEMLLHVHSRDLSTVLGVIEKSATLVYVRPTAESAAVPVPKPRGPEPPDKEYTSQRWKTKPMFPKPKREWGSSRFAGGVANKGVRSEDFILALINSEPKRTWEGSEIGNLMVEKGFAHTSYGPALSKMVKDGRVRRVRQGLYAPHGLTIHLGAAGTSSGSQPDH